MGEKDLSGFDGLPLSSLFNKPDRFFRKKRTMNLGLKRSEV